VGSFLLPGTQGSLFVARALPWGVPDGAGLTGRAAMSRLAESQHLVDRDRARSGVGFAVACHRPEDHVRPRRLAEELDGSLVGARHP
jgi:hypothetical protein